MSEHFVFVNDDNTTIDDSVSVLSTDDSANESGDEVPTEEMPDELGGNPSAPDASSPILEDQQEQVRNK